MTLEETKTRLLTLSEQVTPEWLAAEIDACIAQISRNMERFGMKFPSAEATNGKYRIKENDDWTNGFWTGMLWLAYEWTNDPKFYTRALENIESFNTRLADHSVLDHHDIGFLYSLSAGAGYKITGNGLCKSELLAAAEVLRARYQARGEFIQAWGAYGAENEYRLIIDSLINLPLLFEASKLSGDPKYATVAKKHYQTVLKTVIRNDATTFHTYYFDPKTGQPTCGVTHQGNRDTSIWARGQSWAILGIPLNQSFLATPYPKNYGAIVDVMLENLPADLVPYWDFDFTDHDPSAKDSSALAITACGLLEAAQVAAYPKAQQLACGMLYQLGEQYAAKTQPENEGLLLHGVYAHALRKGIDEPNLWGDYFYLEALMRVARPEWQRYW